MSGHMWSHLVTCRKSNWVLIVISYGRDFYYKGYGNIYMVTFGHFGHRFLLRVYWSIGHFWSQVFITGLLVNWSLWSLGHHGAYLVSIPKRCDIATFRVFGQSSVTYVTKMTKNVMMMMSFVGSCRSKNRKFPSHF